jgi:hypothetical protein
MSPALVDEELWELIQPLLPRKTRRYRHPGRRRIDDRKVLNGILFVLITRRSQVQILPPATEKGLRMQAFPFGRTPGDLWVSPGAGATRPCRPVACQREIPRDGRVDPEPERVRPRERGAADRLNPAGGTRADERRRVYEVRS